MTGRSPHLRVGIDTGGTFTDIVCVDALTGFARYSGEVNCWIRSAPSRAMASISGAGKKQGVSEWRKACGVWD